MRDSDLERAVALARATVGADEDVPAKTYTVRRQDRDESYVIVQLGRTAQPGWVVAVDVARDDVMTWAANETGTTTVPTKRPSKLSSADAEWVWMPSRSSLSPLYPLLRLSNAEGEWLVDLTGAVTTRPATGRG